MSRYETVYALWRDGWVGDRQVQDALGPRILEAMARQQLSGDLPEATTVVGFESLMIWAGVPHRDGLDDDNNDGCAECPLATMPESEKTSESG